MYTYAYTCTSIHIYILIYHKTERCRGAGSHPAWRLRPGIDTVDTHSHPHIYFTHSHPRVCLVWVGVLVFWCSVSACCACDLCFVDIYTVYASICLDLHLQLDVSRSSFIHV